MSGGINDYNVDNDDDEDNDSDDEQETEFGNKCLYTNIKKEEQVDLNLSLTINRIAIFHFSQVFHMT